MKARPSYPAGLAIGLTPLGQVSPPQHADRKRRTESLPKFLHLVLKVVIIHQEVMTDNAASGEELFQCTHRHGIPVGGCLVLNHEEDITRPEHIEPVAPVGFPFLPAGNGDGLQQGRLHPMVMAHRAKPLQLPKDRRGSLHLHDAEISGAQLSPNEHGGLQLGVDDGRYTFSLLCRELPVMVQEHLVEPRVQLRF